ncbi:MAG TPA: ABC transporter permease [Alphaproteobacteria bacterium]|nr:ABC transporter permease [Alphaproteobacteria bacterium]
MAAPTVRPFGRVNWIGAATLLRREWARHRKEAWETMVFPPLLALLYITVIALGLGEARGTEQGREIVAFVVPGVVLFTFIMRAAENTAFSLLLDKLEGTVADLLSTPLSALELTAVFALSGTTAAVATGIPTMVAVALTYGLTLAHPWAVAAFALAASLMMALFGTLVALWARKWDHFGAAFGFVLVPLTMLSGMYAPISALPGWAQPLLSANPIAWAIDGFRYGLTGRADLPVGWGLAGLVLADALMALAVWSLIRRGWRLKG